MSVDASVEEGLRAPRFSARTDKLLSSVIATPGKRINPIDIYPDMNVHGFEKTTTEILKALLDDDDIHGVIIISFALHGGGEIYQPLLDLIKSRQNKPVFFSVLGAEGEVKDSSAFLAKQHMPVYLFPETGVRVFARMRRYARMLEQSR